MDYEEYYLSDEFKKLLRLPSDIKFRQIKFVWGDRAVQLSKPITESGALISEIVRQKPEHIYYSVSSFREPYKIHGLNGGGDNGLFEIDRNGVENRFLYKDLVFDIDRDDIGVARRDTLELIDFLKRNKIINKPIIRFSGSKGFHIMCKKPSIYETCYSIDDFKNQTNEIVELVKSSGIEIDEPVTKDIMRVIRLPGTINMKSGLPCVQIKQRTLEDGFEEFVGQLPKVNFYIPAFERGNPMTKDSFAKQTDGGGVEGRTPPVYIDSYVPETDARIPIIHFKYKPYWLEIKAIQQQHKLSDCYLFNNNEKYTLVSLDVVSVEKARKIAKIGSYSAYDIINHDRLRINGNLVKVFPSHKDVRSNACLSRAHYRLWRLLDYPVFTPNYFSGGGGSIPVSVPIYKTQNINK